MSENQRLKEWLDLYDEGALKNPNSDLHKREKKQIVVNVTERVVADRWTYVGFWRRFFASIVDFFILLFISGLFQIDTFFTLFILHVLYVTLLQMSVLQGTIGKVAIGAVVIGGRGDRLDFTRSLARALSIYVSALLFFIGFIMVAANAEKKGLHDLIAGSMVVNKDSVKLR